MYFTTFWPSTRALLASTMPWHAAPGQLEAPTSRVLATSEINKRHWGLSFAAHKKMMGGINKGNQYFNHIKVIGPWENNN